MSLELISVGFARGLDEYLEFLENRTSKLLNDEEDKLFDSYLTQDQKSLLTRVL
jgi:hypothetical protein